MAQNTTIFVPANTWTQITNSAATAIRVQPLGDLSALLELQATVGEVPPTNSLGAVRISKPSYMKLNEIWVGVAGANRVYARCDTAIEVSVSHD